MTVAEWRKRATVEDMKTGPKEPRSAVLTAEEEAAVAAFRRPTLLPQDDGFYALRAIGHHRRKVRFFSTIELVKDLKKKAKGKAGQIAESLTRLDFIRHAARTHGAARLNRGRAGLPAVLRIWRGSALF